MSIEVMKQVLEALEEVQKYDKTSEWFDKKVSALRQAIEQAEKLKPTLWLGIGGDGRVKYTTDSDRALKWKQAGSYRLVRDYYTSPVHASDISQERVDETAKDRHDLTCVCGAVWVGEEMVCSPRKREWVGLTDEEINEAQDTAAVEFRKNKYKIRGQMVMPNDSPDWWFARAIEAKLKERNNG